MTGKTMPSLTKYQLLTKYQYKYFQGNYYKKNSTPLYNGRSPNSQADVTTQNICPLIIMFSSNEKINRTARRH